MNQLANPSVKRKASPHGDHIGSRPFKPRVPRWKQPVDTLPKLKHPVPWSKIKETIGEERAEKVMQELGSSRKGGDT